MCRALVVQVMFKGDGWMWICWEHRDFDGFYLHRSDAVWAAGNHERRERGESGSGHPA